MRDFEGKVALVSGGSRGIGRACALELARRGATVVIGYAARAEAAQETLAAIEAAGAKGLALAFDVADESACAAAVDQVVKTFGKLDVLVHSAGIAVDGLVMRVSQEDWQRQLAVNVGGAFHLAKAASRPMIRQKGGAIVHLTSVVGETGSAGQSAYAASKSALIGFTKSLARELSKKGVRVNAVSPGFIDTEMTAGINAERREALLENVPLGRLGTPQDVASAVAFLASDAAAYVTGEVLRVNGGMLM